MCTMCIFGRNVTDKFNIKFIMPIPKYNFFVLSKPNVKFQCFFTYFINFYTSMKENEKSQINTPCEDLLHTN